MPCDTIQKTSVSFNMRTDRNLLHAALEQMGERPNLLGDTLTFRSGRYNCATGQMTVTGYGEESEKLNEIKRAYSAQVVQSQARRFGWTLKQTSKYEYQVLKR